MEKLVFDLKHFKSENYIYAFKWKDKYYVGKTGSSNKTGRSSIYGRLASHLRKIGNTLSFFYDKLKIRNKNGEVQFFFEKVPSGIKPTEVEKFIIAELRNRGYHLLNANNKYDSSKAHYKIRKFGTEFIIKLNNLSRKEVFTGQNGQIARTYTHAQYKWYYNIAFVENNSTLKVKVFTNRQLIPGVKKFKFSNNEVRKIKTESSWSPNLDSRSNEADYQIIEIVD